MISAFLASFLFFSLPFHLLSPRSIMPGSKRRALKNLLSPHSASPATSPSGSSTEPAPSVQSSMAPADELALVEGMEARQTMISPRGASPVSALSIPAAQQVAPVDVSGETSTSPRRKQHGGFAGLYSRRENNEVTADELAGDGNGGKKKSSKQRFLEREVRLFPFPLPHEA